MRSLPLLVVLVIAVGGFTYFGSETARTLPKAGQYDRYFTTPKASVETVTRLLKAGDWSTLASYYDLTGGTIGLDTLISGVYFASADPTSPDSTSPGPDAALVRPAHPFELGARYLSAKPLDDDEIEVTIVLEGAEQDEDGQPKTGTFHLKAHPEGYKLIPNQ